MQNSDISIKARGLFITMWSLPDDWQFSIGGLAAILPDGKGSIRTAIKELEEHGYLFREQVNKGKFGNNIYVLHDDPVVQKGDNAKGDGAKLDIINKELDKVTNKQKSSSNSARNSVQRNWTY